MKQQSTWASALALAITAAAVCVETQAGVIMISTRAPQDTQYSTEFVSDERGPGMVTPGDVAMASWLHENGYTCRLILDRLLGPGAADIGQDSATFLNPVNTNMALDLIIMSGSGGSTDTPPPPPGIPLMMGEHVCLGDRTDRQGSIFMYFNGSQSSDPNEGTGASKYMKVVAPNHPIMQGIPLDTQGRVKIFREQYPQEELHVPTGGKRNFEYRWCTQAVSNAAPCTTVLGVLDGAEDRACFAVADVGGLNANSVTVSNRLVHLFANEQGSGGSRRVFLALTDLGRIIFVRAAKWAVGETLQPYSAFRITEVSQAAAQSIKVSWESSAQHNYKIQASTDFSNWQTVIDDAAGADGILSRTLNLGAAPQTLFLRIGRMP